MRRSIFRTAPIAAALMALGSIEHEASEREPDNRPCPPRDDEAVAKIRAERAKRKAENFAKRQPKPPTSPTRSER
jgi:hypothetical protein